MLSKTSEMILETLKTQLELGDDKGLKEYGESIDSASNYDWNLMALEEATDMLKYQQKEINYLRKRLHEFKKKDWFKVYQENLELIKANDDKFADLIKYEKTINQLRNELIQCGEIANNYYIQGLEMAKENQHLKEVVKSVETFIAERTK